MAWRLETQKGYQMPQQYLKTTLPNRPGFSLNWGSGRTLMTPTAGNSFGDYLKTLPNASQANTLYQSGGNGINSLGYLQWQADRQWNNPLQSSMAAANKETAGNPYNVQYGTQGLGEWDRTKAAWSGVNPAIGAPVAGFNTIDGKRVSHQRPFGLTVKPNAIPNPYSINDLGQHSRLVKHTNVGGPMGGLLGVAGAGLGFSGALGSMLGGLSPGLQTAAKIGGGINTLVGAVRGKGRNVPGAMLGLLGN